MPQPLESFLIRILSPNDRVVGAAFLVDGRTVLTCAHVVQAALGLRECPDAAPPDVLSLDFPLIAAGQKLNARVTAWYPQADIAVLMLLDGLPSGAEPARLVQAEDLWKHTFRAFGFPSGYDNGVYAHGNILGREASGWLQIEDVKQSGYFVQPGFSGGPVWDEDLQAVVGMVTAADMRARSGFVIPTSLLALNHPLLLQSIVSASSQDPYPGEPPYKGLQYFDVADSALFFGREALTAQLVQRMAYLHDNHAARFLAIVGASGSGKSSLARAGLVPAWKAGIVTGAATLSGPVHIITPTTHPLESLAASLTHTSESVSATATLMDDLRREPRSLHLFARKLLAAPNQDNRAHLLLLVDQFEELFTLCHDPQERQAFVDNLLFAAGFVSQGQDAGDGPVFVILTLRADFYHHCAAYDGLRSAMEKYQAYIGQMNVVELRRAVEQPALDAGWEFESGLVDLMLRDAGSEPGALPLLSHALLETWKRRRGRTMTLSGYHEAGGVRGAIAKTAEAVYQHLNPERQIIARNIFLRLTEPGEGTQDTRRRATLDELVSAPEKAGEVQAVLDTLTDARLVTTAEGSAEVAHEALIREWGTLRRWLEEDREGLRIRHHLTETAGEWQQRGRDPAELYRGARLAQALEWQKSRRTALSPLEAAFLQESRAALAKEKRAAQLRWGGIAGGVLLALLVVILALSGVLDPFIYRPLPMEYVDVPAGEFLMGSTVEQVAAYGKECTGCDYSIEQPQHRVYLDTFQIGKFEVTNRQYMQCVRAGACTGNSTDPAKDDHPVVSVAWFEADSFCRWNGGRLPTEAEWEKAARGTDGRIYPWGDESPTCDLANYTGCGKDTKPVGSTPKGASVYGAQDMAGNVWEWVNDWYDGNYYQNSPQKNPTGPDSGEYRVLRGGSWDDESWDLRAASRVRYYPNFRLDFYGFRCVGF